MGEYVLCDRGFVPTITTVVEREMAQRVRYHPGLRAAEDVDFAIRLALEGCTFRMLEEPGAIWNDHDDPGRASARNKADEFGAWLTQMKPYLTAKTWHGGRGWPYARMLAHNGHKMEALRLYLTALAHGCYRPRLSVIVFLQVFLNANSYRAIADVVIGWLRKDAGTRPEQSQTGMITRRTALISGAAALAAPAFAQMPSLRALAAAKGILFGSAAASYELKDADFAALLPREAAILVPEYEMKRDVVEPSPGAYDFSGCDALMTFRAGTWHADARPSAGVALRQSALAGRSRPHPPRCEAAD